MHMRIDVNSVDVAFCGVVRWRITSCSVV